MAENRTKATKASVDEYIAAIEDDTRRKDCEALSKLMAKATKHKPTMWGTAIVGFGSYHYKYESRVAKAIPASQGSHRAKAISAYISWRIFPAATNCWPNWVSTRWPRLVSTSAG